MHNPDNQGNSLFNFRDTEDDITKEEEILKGEAQPKRDEIIENIENTIDTEKLKNEILNEKSSFDELLSESSEGDYLKFLNE